MYKCSFFSDFRNYLTTLSPKGPFVKLPLFMVQIQM